LITVTSSGASVLCIHCASNAPNAGESSDSLSMARLPAASAQTNGAMLSSKG